MPADSNLLEPVERRRTRAALIYKGSNFRDFVGRMNDILKELNREQMESATLSIRPMLETEDLWIGCAMRFDPEQPK